MANQTATINLITGQWIQVAAAGEQAVVTPKTPTARILLRYATTQPAAGIVIGHIFNNAGEVTSVIIGSENTDNAWMRPFVDDIDVEVTIL